MTARGRLYRESGGVIEDIDIAAADMRLSNDAVAQISALPKGEDHGFLLRVWPAGGTPEHGRGMTALTAVFRFTDDGRTVIEYINADTRG